MYNSNSKEKQDLFVLSVLDKKINGTYVEIGGGLGTKENNTYLLETEYGWKGFSIESIPWIAETHSSRKNPCLCIDATNANYDELFNQYNLGDHIDYLQLDIDPPSSTLAALKKINFDKFSFSVITYEHDAYNGGNLEREKSRKFLESWGYTRVIGDVMHKGWAFEDWYINEKYMFSDNWKEFIGDEIELFNINEKYTKLFEKFLN
jgi:hypothetical protein